MKKEREAASTGETWGKYGIGVEGKRIGMNDPENGGKFVGRKS